MRIGTWNLDGRWSDRHAGHLVALDCDVLLLTEVSPGTVLDGYQLHLGGGVASSGQHWAAIASRADLLPSADPHVASAMAQVDGRTFCSSVLPWRGCDAETWGDGDLAAKMQMTLDKLRASFAGVDVWGGDWNAALGDQDWTSSRGARAALRDVLDDLRLQVPTAALPSQRPGVLSIDHVALRERVPVTACQHVPSGPLSDHDAYVVVVPTNQDD